MDFSKYVKVKGDCDHDCDIAEWTKHICNHRDNCPIGEGLVWKKALVSDEVILVQAGMRKNLRDNHLVFVEVPMYIKEDGDDALYAFKYVIKESENYKVVITEEKDNYPNYEAAEKAGILKAIDNLKRAGIKV